MMTREHWGVTIWGDNVLYARSDFGKPLWPVRFDLTYLHRESSHSSSELIVRCEHAAGVQGFGESKKRELSRRKLA